MTRDELIEKVACKLCAEIIGHCYNDMPESASYMHRKTNPESAIMDKQEAREVASTIINTIYAAMQEPSEEMIEDGSVQFCQEYEAPSIWQAMLAASPLAQIEKSEPVAWMHPEAGWTDVSKAEVAVHCKDGAEPTPLYTAPVASVADLNGLLFHLAQLRHAYSHLKKGTVVNQAEFADGLLSPAIKAIEYALEKEPE